MYGPKTVYQADEQGVVTPRRLIVYYEPGIELTPADVLDLSSLPEDTAHFIMTTVWVEYENQAYLSQHN